MTNFDERVINANRTMCSLSHQEVRDDVAVIFNPLSERFEYHKASLQPTDQHLIKLGRLSDYIGYTGDLTDEEIDNCIDNLGDYLDAREYIEEYENMLNEMVVDYINNLTADQLIWTGNPVLVYANGEVKIVDQMGEDDVELLDANLDWTPAKRYLPSNNYGDFILSNHHLGYIKDKFLADWNANKQ